MKTLPDGRYSCRLEWCGAPTRRFVVRFCGDWIGQYETLGGAVSAASTHEQQRWN